MHAQVYVTCVTTAETRQKKGTVYCEKNDLQANNKCRCRVYNRAKTDMQVQLLMEKQVTEQPLRGGRLSHFEYHATLLLAGIISNLRHPYTVTVAIGSSGQQIERNKNQGPECNVGCAPKCVSRVFRTFHMSLQIESPYVLCDSDGELSTVHGRVVYQEFDCVRSIEVAVSRPLREVDVSVSRSLG